jgi:ABC-2 type transport system permease protein
MNATVMARRGSVWAQAWGLSWRSIVGAARQPSSWIPGMFFPLMLATVYSAQFSKVVDLPAFPFEDITFLEFMLPAAVVQGVSFGSINGGSELALDIENGFMDRLLSSPVSRTAILVGRLAGSMAYAVVMAIVLIMIFMLMGAGIAGGVGGVVVVVVTSALLALSLGSLAAALALKTGSQEVVQSVFPLVFVLIFVSSAFFPVALMEGWYAELAKRNPITWMIDPTRRLTVVGFSWGDAGQAIGIAAGLAALGVLVAFRSLRRRMASL